MKNVINSCIDFGMLRENAITDVLIIGGGIAGLTAAYNLLKEGRKVVIIENEKIGSGEKSPLSGHISCAVETRYADIERTSGMQKAMLAASSQMAAIDWIEKIISNEKIECNFRRINGYLIPGIRDTTESLNLELDATRKAGLSTEILEKTPGLEKGSCIMFPDQGQLNSLKYLKGLADSVVRLGGIIYSQTRADLISYHEVRANGHLIKANYIVIASNTPLNNGFLTGSKLTKSLTYVIGARIRKGVLPYALWWDTAERNSGQIFNPFHFVRLTEYNNDYDLLISRGEGHEAGKSLLGQVTPEDRFTRLINWTRKMFHSMWNIEYKWSGQIVETTDLVAAVGKDPDHENVYVITGDSGNGITHRTLGGIIITDLISGKNSSWENFFKPSRVRINNSGDYIYEPGSVNLKYHLF